MSRLPRSLAWTLALLMGCSGLPTSLCGCPPPCPPTSHFVIYGDVFRGEAWVPSAQVSVSAHATTVECQAESIVETLEPRLQADASGHFRATVFSSHGPTIRCVRVTALVARNGIVDSVVSDGAMVQFRPEEEPPDSVKVVVNILSPL